MSTAIWLFVYTNHHTIEPHQSLYKLHNYSIRTISFHALKLVAAGVDSISYIMATNIILPGRETKIETACKLVPTLETWCGMVKNQGNTNRKRPSSYPKRAQKCPAHAIGRFAWCRRGICKPLCFMCSGTTVARWICQNVRDVHILQGNVHACCTTDTGVEFMKKIIRAPVKGST